MRLIDEALARHRAANAWNVAALLIFENRGQAGPLLLGDFELARTLYDKCKAMCAPLGETFVLSWARWNLGIALWATGRPPRRPNGCATRCDQWASSTN